MNTIYNIVLKISKTDLSPEDKARFISAVENNGYLTAKEQTELEAKLRERIEENDKVIASLSTK